MQTQSSQRQYWWKMNLNVNDIRVYSIIPLKEFYPNQEREDYFFVIVAVDNAVVTIKWLNKIPDLVARRDTDGIDYKTPIWINNHTSGIDHYERCANKPNTFLAV